jgi:hypothetical protein
MCDEIIQPFVKQTSNEMEIFKPNAIAIPYIGPSMGGTTKLISKLNQKTTVFEKISFEVTGPICNKKTYLETSGILNIKKFQSGPYQNIGEGIQYKELFFIMNDLSMNIIVKYNFEPSNICKILETQTNSYEPNSVDHPFEVIVDPSGGISYDTKTYKVLNNNDPNNRNKLFDDLNNPNYLATYNEQWRRFYDVILNALFEQTDFGQKIDREFQRILCTSGKNQPQPSSKVIKEEHPYLVFLEKIDTLKKSGDVHVIRISNTN